MGRNFVSRIGPGHGGRFHEIVELVCERFNPEFQKPQFTILARNDFVQAFNVVILKRQAAFQFVQS